MFGFPQGLKPRIFDDRDGTAKEVAEKVFSRARIPPAAQSRF